MERLWIIYACAAAAVAALIGGRMAVEVLRRRRAGRREALAAAYLRLTMEQLLTGDGRLPRYPDLSGGEAYDLLIRTLARLSATTCGLDPTPLRRIVAGYGLERRLMHRIRLSGGYRRAELLLQLAALPGDRGRARRVGRYASDRSRAVRFATLVVQLAADPEGAMRRLAAWPEPFSAAEVAEVVALLRRGMLPIAWERLLDAPRVNLRRIGLAVVRQFGIEEAEPVLHRLLAREAEETVAVEALHLLCELRCPLDEGGIRRRVAELGPADRRSLVRALVREGYAADAIACLMEEDDEAAAVCEQLVGTYKCTLV